MLEAFAAVHPNGATQPFWDACKRGELRFQRCSACGRFRHPPLPGCPHCADPRSEWVAVEGRGRVFSYTVVHHPAMPEIADQVPYAVVLIEFDDAPGVRLISNLLDTPVEDVQVDMPVELVWHEAAEGLSLPRFRPARG